MIKKLTGLFFSLAVMAAFVVAPVVHATTDYKQDAIDSSYGLKKYDGEKSGDDWESDEKLKLGDNNLDTAAVDFINILLGFLGLIAVIIILWGGFRWMTAGGNEDNVGAAKKIIISGVVGLLIIGFAFSIARFVVDKTLEGSGVNITETP